jgi:NAD(P)-dependent dehydrogenase (short-subunit alcohol dehydrogenase family)
VDTTSSRELSDHGPVTLVVGATGILRPAALSLLSHGSVVIAVGRDVDRLAELSAAAEAQPGQLREVRTDATDPGFVDEIGAVLSELDRTLVSAVVYAPAISAESADEIMRRWNPRLVEILTSRWAEPTVLDREWTVADLPRAPDLRHRLVLGWQRVQSRSAWHTPEQISAAALAALDLPGDRILGRVHPWSDRP